MGSCQCTSSALFCCVCVCECVFWESVWHLTGSLSVWGQCHPSRLSPKSMANSRVASCSPWQQTSRCWEVLFCGGQEKSIGSLVSTFLTYRGLLAGSASVFLMEEMKEKAKCGKFKDQFAIQIGKDLFTRITCGISKIFLLTFTILLTPTPTNQNQKGKENVCVCCHHSLTDSKVVTSHWVVFGRGN